MEVAGSSINYILVLSLYMSGHKFRPEFWDPQMRYALFPFRDLGINVNDFNDQAMKLGLGLRCKCSEGSSEMDQ